MDKFSVAERRNTAVKMVKDSGQVSVGELSRLFGVSEVTVRKDLEYLENRNLLIRTHGGAMQNEYLVYDSNFEDKSRKNAEKKRRIGRAAVDLIQEGDTILLDAGTTVMQVARQLHDKRNLTLITCAVNVATELIRIPENQIVMLGGEIRASSAAVVGPFAEKMVREYYCRKLFLGCDGFDVDFGITTTNVNEAHLNRVMIESAHETILLLDSSKFDRRGLSKICGLEKISKIITDDGIPDKIKKTLHDLEIPVIIV